MDEEVPEAEIMCLKMQQPLVNLLPKNQTTHTHTKKKKGDATRVAPQCSSSCRKIIFCGSCHSSREGKNDRKLAPVLNNPKLSVHRGTRK